MRKISIYSTRGASGSFMSDAQNWGEIIDQVEQIINDDLSSLTATENVNKTNLGHSEAVLPQTDFTIFLRPSKTKSGKDIDDMNFMELRIFIKNEEEDCREFLNKRAKENGKNWTQLKVDELQKYLKEWNGDSESKEDEVERLEKEFNELKKGFC